MATNKERKTVKLKSALSLNIGFVILGLVCVYLFINMVIYFTTEKTSYYEVVEGSNSEDLNTSYVGIALRDETIFTSKAACYIDY